MNAGAMGGDMWSVFRSAVALNEDGDIVEFEKESMKGAIYRRIPEFEQRLREFMDVRYEDVLTAIRTTGKLEADTEEKLKTAITALLEEFK